MSFEAQLYEDGERWKAEVFGPVERQRFATLAEKLPLDVETLLDVGCGNGLFLKHISEGTKRRLKRVCGADRSEAALACVETEKVRASIDALPFGKGEFDAVSCLEVLEHLPQTTFADALGELSRIARRYILISVPYNEDLRRSLTECSKCCCRFNPYSHLRSFNPASLAQLFDDKGFVCRDVFFMHRNRDMPVFIENGLKVLGMAKRALLRQPRSIMASQSICPICGYSPRASSGNEGAKGVALSQTRIGKKIRTLLSFKPGWRWIGALYERA